MSDTIIVRRTGQAPLRVRGKLLAEVESSFNTAHPNYSGSTGRAQSVRVFKTAAGRHVVAIHYGTQWQGEHATDEAAVFPSIEECVAFLQDRVPGWMLQALMGELGEEAMAEEVD